MKDVQKIKQMKSFDFLPKRGIGFSLIINITEKKININKKQGSEIWISESKVVQHEKEEESKLVRFLTLAIKIGSRQR
jgi:hypothetical protein